MSVRCATKPQSLHALAHMMTSVLQDHFLEEDTTLHSWEALAQLFQSGCTDDMLCDFGMPVMFQSVRYNCRLLCLNRRILLIRPKLFLANDGNYRETRWFTRWQHGWVLKECSLPPFFSAATSDGQTHAPIGANQTLMNPKLNPKPSTLAQECLLHSPTRLPPPPPIKANLDCSRCSKLFGHCLFNAHLEQTCLTRLFFQNTLLRQVLPC
jgi:hypothetical protein